MDTPATLSVRTGFEGNLSPEQVTALAELKAKVATSEFAKDLSSHPDGDRYLLRFLRATAKDKKGAMIFRVDPCYERLVQTCEFRRKYKADEIMRSLEADEVKLPPRWDEYLEIRPALTYVSSNGNIIRLERMGLFVQHLDPKCFSDDEWIIFFIYDGELLMHKQRQQSALHGREISTYNAIVDETGVGLGMMAITGFLKMMNHVGNLYYPEMLNKLWITRSPWIFDKIYNTIKFILDEDTRGKLIVTTGFPMDSILQVIPDAVEKLPVEYGGKSEDKLGVPLHARPKQ